MEPLGQQLSSLAQQLIRDAEARREAVARIRADSQQMRGQFTRELRQTTRDVQQLNRDVLQTITDNRRRRMRVASEDSLARRQMMTRLQRQTARDLESHRSHRLRGDRARGREANATLQRIRRSVQEIRGSSRRFTANVSAQMQSGRQAIARARQEIAARRLVVGASVASQASQVAADTPANLALPANLAATSLAATASLPTGL